jgi:hypothetical protein
VILSDAEMQSMDVISDYHNNNRDQAEYE